VGGASGSTAGGIKINTMMVLAIAAYASVRGRPRPEAFKRELPYAQVARAMAIVVLALVVLMALVMALALTEGAKLEAGTFEFLDVLFEATSAFGTTGLSRGITSELSDPGRVVLTIGMYLGRLGPLTIALGLALRERRAVYRFAEERVRIG
jgi:trk system potassium uptake protein TrkH